MKKLLQFGAGNIGRSLVGQIFSRAGWEVVFVDAIPAIVEALNERRGYVVRVKDTLRDGDPDSFEVVNVRCLHIDDDAGIAQAVAEADVISTSVGARNIPGVMRLVALGLNNRTKPVSIMLCENVRDASHRAAEDLKKYLPAGFTREGNVGFVETSIGKMVPIMPADLRQSSPVEVWGEAYNKLIADRNGFIPEVPDVPGLVPVDNIAAHVDRKLFIHNLGHAVAAYHGYLRGKTHIWECMAEEAIHAEARDAMWESGRALIAHYPGVFTEEGQREHIDDLLRRFANRALGDTVYRVGRDLRRKLSPDDRCIGAARICLAEGVDPANIVRAIAAGFHFRATDDEGRMFAADAELHRALEAKGLNGMLDEVCGLDPERDAALVEKISAAYESLA